MCEFRPKTTKLWIQLNSKKILAPSFEKISSNYVMQNFVKIIILANVSDFKIAHCERLEDELEQKAKKSLDSCVKFELCFWSRDFW